MYRLFKFDDLIAREYKARADVKYYLGQKQQVLDKYQKKMKLPYRRLQKKANHANVRGDLETQRLNLLTQGEDNEELKKEIEALRLKYPGCSSLYDSNKIPMLKK